MGTGNSNAATISIFVDFNEGHQFLVAPGTEVVGKVCIQMLKEIVGDHALTVKIVGEEVKPFDDSSKHYNQGGGTEIYEARSVFFSKGVEFTLSEAELGETYVFPFSFALPSGLPPSMKFASPQNKHDLCSINYSVEVKLIKYRQSLMSTSLIPTVVDSSSLPLYVPYQPVAVVSRHSAAYVQEPSLNVGSYLGMGGLGLSACFPATMNSCNEGSVPATVGYPFGSFPTASIQQIELDVVENITWDADGYSKKFTVTKVENFSSRILARNEPIRFETSCEAYTKRGDNSPAYDRKVMQVQHNIIMTVIVCSSISIPQTRVEVTSNEDDYSSSISIPQTHVEVTSNEDDYSSSSPVSVLTTSSLSPSTSTEDLLSSWENAKDVRPKLPVAHPISK
jgi:hypothetical protein